MKNTMPKIYFLIGKHFLSNVLRSQGLEWFKMRAHIVAHSGNDSHMRNSEMLVANLELNL